MQTTKLFKLTNLKGRINDNDWQIGELRKAIVERDHRTAEALRLVMRK